MSPTDRFLYKRTPRLRPGDFSPEAIQKTCTRERVALTTPGKRGVDFSEKAVENSLAGLKIQADVTKKAVFAEYRSRSLSGGVEVRTKPG